MTEETKKAWKSIAEEIDVSSKHLLSEIHRLVAEGNIRKLVVKSADGHVFLTIPLTAGAVAGGILTLGAPWLAVLAAVAGVVANLKIEVTRDGTAASDASATSDAPTATSDSTL